MLQKVLGGGRLSRAPSPRPTRSSQLYRDFPYLKATVTDFYKDLKFRGFFPLSDTIQGN